jgi:aerobic carbon-monoxide dehydrogenase large subunit
MTLGKVGEGDPGEGGGHSIEARGLVAQYDRVEDLLTVWDSTQMPHRGP